MNADIAFEIGRYLFALAGFLLVLVCLARDAGLPIAVLFGSLLLVSTGVGFLAAQLFDNRNIGLLAAVFPILFLLVGRLIYERYDDYRTMQRLRDERKTDDNPTGDLLVHLEQLTEKQRAYTAAQKRRNDDIIRETEARTEEIEKRIARLTDKTATPQPKLTVLPGGKRGKPQKK